MVRQIPLTRGLFALVDDDDYEELAKHKWHAMLRRRSRHPDQFYAVRNVPTSNPKKWVGVFMHKAILEIGRGVMGDHINGDTLDNRRENLRRADNSQNQANRTVRNPNSSSRFRGVTWHRKLSKWQVTIQSRGINQYLGVFDDEEVAARTYDTHARLLFGEFARPNFPEGIAS